LTNKRKDIALKFPRNEGLNPSLFPWEGGRKYTRKGFAPSQKIPAPWEGEK